MSRTYSPHTIKSAQRLYVQWSHDIDFDYSTGKHPSGYEADFDWEEKYVPVVHYIGTKQVGATLWRREKIGENGSWTAPIKLTGYVIPPDQEGSAVKAIWIAEDGTIYYELQDGTIVSAGKVSTGEVGDRIVDFTYIQSKNTLVLKGENEIWNVELPDSTSFLNLSDTPVIYTGQANKVVAVNSTETGLVFTDETNIDETNLVHKDSSFDDSNDREEITGSKYFNNRLLKAQGADISMTEEVVMLFDGNTWVGSDVSLTALNGFDTTGWTNGSNITLYLDSGQLIAHDAAVTGTTAPIRMPDGIDFTTTLPVFTKCIFQLIEKNGETFWAADYFAQASQVERTLFTATITNVLTDNADTETIYIGFDSNWLNTVNITNDGNASLNKVNGSIIATSIGSVHYVEFSVGGTVIAVMPCEEMPRTNTGSIYFGNTTRHLIFLNNYVSWNNNNYEIVNVVNLQAATYLDTDKSWNHQKGFQTLTDNSNNNYMYIPHLDDGSTII